MAEWKTLSPSESAIIGLRALPIPQEAALLEPLRIEVDWSPEGIGLQPASGLVYRPRSRRVYFDLEWNYFSMSWWIAFYDAITTQLLLRTPLRYARNALNRFQHIVPFRGWAAIPFDMQLRLKEVGITRGSLGKDVQVWLGFGRRFVEGDRR